MLLALVASAVVAAAPQAADRPPGSVVSSAPLRRGLWLPNTRTAYLLRYATTSAKGRRALSTGTVFLPEGRAPRGGWPVISWAHGTSGLGDACAPSRVGPALPDRDRPYLGRWLEQGYATVASDYAGLGTRGLPAYLHGRSTAHNVVDMVKAGRRHLAGRSRDRRLSRRWAVVGQSQGGGAAISTARYATRFGGRGLDFRGAVGTGVPAYIERLVRVFGPGCRRRRWARARPPTWPTSTPACATCIPNSGSTTSSRRRGGGTCASPRRPASSRSSGSCRASASATGSPA